MRTSAKHTMLVSMLFPAFLLLGCNTPTGLPDVVPPEKAPDIEATGEVPGPDVDRDSCFEFNGTQHCPSMEDPGALRRAL